MKRFIKNNRLLIIAGSIVVIIGGGIGLFYASNYSNKTAITPSSSVSPSTARSKASTNSSSPHSDNSTTPATKQTSPSTTAASTQLAPPQGQASHLKVSKSALDQDPHSPNLEVSCLTSSSNNCVVRLTSPSGQVSTINSTSDDHKGNFIFDWSAQSYATGTWKMELVASRNGQDAAVNIGPLEVSP